MDLLELKERVELMQSDIRSTIENVNCGGCIHFAYYFTEALKKIGHPYKVFFCNTRWDNRVGRSYDTFLPVNHVLVYVEKIGFIDGTDTIEAKEYNHKQVIKRVYYYHNVLKLNLNKLRSKYTWCYLYDKAQNNTLSAIVNNYIK